MSDQKNIRIIWHLFVSFPDNFVICGVTIESPIESPMESSKILTSPDSSVQDWPYWGSLYPPKTNYMQVPMTWYNIDHHKSQITNLQLWVTNANKFWECYSFTTATISRNIFNVRRVRPFVKISPNCLAVSILSNCTSLLKISSRNGRQPTVRPTLHRGSSKQHLINPFPQPAHKQFCDRRTLFIC
jgi:hypothetical protein